MITTGTDFMTYFNTAFGSHLGNRISLFMSSLIVVLLIASIGIYINKAISAVDKNSERALFDIIYIVVWAICSLAISIGLLSIWGS